MWLKNWMYWRKQTFLKFLLIKYKVPQSVFTLSTNLKNYAQISSQYLYSILLFTTKDVNRDLLCSCLLFVYLLAYNDDSFGQKNMIDNLVAFEINREIY